MLSRRSLAKDIVSLCTKFQYAKTYPVSSIATISFTNNTKLKREDLWQTRGLVAGKRAPTELLFRESLKRIFPNEEIIFKARKSLNIKRYGTGSYLEIDASIPRINFYAEYQDPYHYTTTVYYSNRPLAEIGEIDAFKKQWFAERGESLLQLPCWWDGTDESLVATIKNLRPDLLQHRAPSSPPVPETEPHNFLQYDVVPDTGPLMRPVFFTKNYYDQGGVWYEPPIPHILINNRLGNEKLDGVRCCWNPKQKKLYSRTGNEIRFPEEFKHCMPYAFLDGEVWFGRGQYNESAKLSKLRTTSDINWPMLRISVFDIAGVESTQIEYSERYNMLHLIIPNDHPFLFIPSVIQIHSEEQRSSFERFVVNNGGEGMILTEKNSLYVRGQTSKVLKVKPSLDKEALVVASDGEHLTLQLTDGTRFRTRFPDIRPPPRVRDVITFTYNRCVQGSTLPEKPQIHRVRSDVTWSEVVASANEGVPLSKYSLGRDYAMRWDRNLDDLKGYFTKFALDNNFDPLVAANWYNVQSQDILALPGAAHMLNGFNRSVINALVASFPDIGLDKSMFSMAPRGHWKNIHNVRKWFDQFAKQKGFDPLIAENWYTITRDTLHRNGGRSIIRHFDNSYINAIVTAYPDIGIDKLKFSPRILLPPEMLNNTASLSFTDHSERYEQGHWNESANVRAFLDEFACTAGFDPLVAENWYPVRPYSIHRAGGYALLRHYNFMQALKVAYPELEFEDTKFRGPNKPAGHWRKLTNVRAFFDEFARTSQFDPLVAESWNSVSTRSVERAGGGGILSAHGGNLKKALQFAYSEVQIETDSKKQNITKVQYGHWNEPANVRAFFDEFARTAGFDPLVADNWYSVSMRALQNAGGSGVLSAHGRSIQKALLCAYPELNFVKEQSGAQSNSEPQSVVKRRSVKEVFGGSLNSSSSKHFSLLL